VYLFSKLIPTYIYSVLLKCVRKIQTVIELTHQNKLLFYLPFFRKLKFIFTLFPVNESFMDGTVKVYEKG
jgi:hypothetical protein